MIKIIDARENGFVYEADRAEIVSAEIAAAVDEILLDVKQNGDKAVLRYVEKFDGVRLECLKVSEEEIIDAFTLCDDFFLDTLRLAKENLEKYHSKQIRNDYIINEKDGVILGQKITPIEKVGIYVPGGTASYPSTVLMDAVPAKLAGVGEIIMTTPAGKDGKVAPAILAAAKIAGVSSIYKTGGAGAVAALAYGTKSIPKVDKIVGPGNIFVQTAKQKVSGLVGIDMIAGPSEILVITDDTAEPVFVAADMLSQAEHDKRASAMLVCLSEEYAKKVSTELEKQIPLLPRESFARASIDDYSMIIIASDLVHAAEISNYIAPEHLEICIDDPFSLLGQIKNAGSIFLGKNVPEALGDYLAGTNHTLPTSGTARFSSALSVDDFVKKSSFIYYTKDALRDVSGRIVDFAHREGLDAHGRSVSIRFEGNNV